VLLISGQRYERIDRRLILKSTRRTPGMARTRGNSDQEAGLRKLLSALGTVRKFANVRYQTVLAPTELLVKLDLPDFPVISIGRRGGFKIPDISTYPGAAPPDSLKPPPDGRNAV